MGLNIVRLDGFTVRPVLPLKLRQMGAELICHPPEDDTPFPWAVYDSADEGGDIIGCGYTADEAIADACGQVTIWDVNAALEAGR